MMASNLTLLFPLLFYNFRRRPILDLKIPLMHCITKDIQPYYILKVLNSESLIACNKNFEWKLSRILPSSSSDLFILHGSYHNSFENSDWVHLNPSKHRFSALRLQFAWLPLIVKEGGQPPWISPRFLNNFLILCSFILQYWSSNGREQVPKLFTSPNLHNMPNILTIFYKNNQY